MSTRSADQRDIAAWFDSTYARKGARYLRPPEAYMVFPELLDAGHGDDLLDVACGPGLMLGAASGRARRLHGCDISAVALEQARERVPEAQVLLANAEALPYRSEAFDLVTCLGSLERMLDRTRALREMLRVGREGARYCFLVRNSNTRSWKYLTRSAARQPAHGHPDADTVTNWSELFESVGFRILRVLPDQYPLLRRQLWRTLLLQRVDFQRPVTTEAPLERANEFIFLLEKRR
jgi:SAM-dependent methyltransferase